MEKVIPGVHNCLRILPTEGFTHLAIFPAGRGCGTALLIFKEIRGWKYPGVLAREVVLWWECGLVGKGEAPELRAGIVSLFSC